MRKIIDEDGSRELNLLDLVAEFQSDILDLDRREMDEVEWELMNNQYSYIKFGLILEKVRNQSWWKNCVEKFNDFRQFCQSKINLNIWQAANAIKSAQVAIRLAFLGFEELPRNASQALKMADLSIERLGEVWGQVLKTCQGHKITAGAIEMAVNPDKQSSTETLRLPAGVAEALRRQAIDYGLTLPEYLERLANGEQLEPEPPTSEPTISDEDMNEIMDNLDLKFAKLSKSQGRKSVAQIASQVADSIDSLFTGILGNICQPMRINQ
jgi:hypothetical protein